MQVIRNTGEHGEHEDLGPLAEIDLWRQRSLNMNGIHSQIQKPVIHILSFLSCYSLFFTLLSFEKTYSCVFVYK